MKKSLLLAWMILAIPFLALSQSRQVSGTVTDDKGEPLPAVSVVQKGTNAGTVTNEKGVFFLTVSGPSPVLVFSYSGRQSQELAVGNSNTYNVSLGNNGALSEVVVTALGINRSEIDPQFADGSYEVRDERGVLVGTVAFNRPPA